MTPFLQQPYATGKNWEIWRGDSLDVLVQFRLLGRRFDAVLTDVPYSSGGQFRGDRMADTNTKYLQSASQIAELVPAFEGDTRDQRSFGLWCGVWMRHAFHLLNPNGIFGSFIDWRQLATLMDAMQVAGLVTRGLLPWVKPPGAVRPQRGRFSQSAEFIPWGTRGPFEVRPSIGFLAGHQEIADEVPLFNGTLDADDLAALGFEERTVDEVLEVLGYVRAASPRGKDREHATEKPPAVCDWLLSCLPPGSTVLDPFCGSAAIGEAALRRGCRYVGIEISDEIARMAARRMTKAEASGRPVALFDDSAKPAAEQGVLFASAPRPADTSSTSAGDDAGAEVTP